MLEFRIVGRSVGEQASYRTANVARDILNFTFIIKDIHDTVADQVLRDLRTRS